MDLRTQIIEIGSKDRRPSGEAKVDSGIFNEQYLYV